MLHCHGISSRYFRSVVVLLFVEVCSYVVPQFRSVHDSYYV